MSLDIWLKRSKQVTVGGRELYMMPLPLNRLYEIGRWLETNANDVIKETISTSKDGTVPNPIGLITTVLMRVDVSEMALKIFSTPKNPDTDEPLNPNLTKQFFDDYLDVPTAQELFYVFVELNDLERLIKNLRSLPMIRSLMEASSLAFGIPFLNSLRQNTASAQTQLGGSPSLKSTDTSQPASNAEQADGPEKKSKTLTGGESRLPVM